MKYYSDASKVCDWLLVDVLRLKNEAEIELEDLKFGPKELAKLVDLVESGKINKKTGKNVLREMFDTGKNPDTIVKEKGLGQISDEDVLEEVVDEVIKENAQSVEDFHNGKDRALGFLMGQCMKKTRGKGNPQLFRKMLMERLKK